MTERTTVRGLDITYYMDMVGEQVFYNDITCGIIEDQTFHGGKTDFVIRWETSEIAEMMKDKFTAVDANIVFTVKLLDEEEATL